MQGRHARRAGACEGSPGNLGVILSPEAVGTLFLRRLGWRLVSGPHVESPLSVRHPCSVSTLSGRWK